MNADRPRILVVGGGGREHALCWKIKRDRPDCELFAAPGNAGIEGLATLVALPADDIKGIVAWCREDRPDLVVVGPDGPLANGLVDALAEVGIRAFGPTAAAARIEASKAWAAEVCAAAGVPTPESHAFGSADGADAFVRERAQPYVVKADGLALGKGVFVCDTVAETLDAIDRLMRRLDLGPAGENIMLQERLSGPELSVFALCDGTTLRVIGSARDHKRLGDGDVGPNTGGMGAYTPVPGVTAAVLADIQAHVFAPVVAELRQRGCPFVGFLYAGLMHTADGYRVIEFNCRMGDPEAQVLLPLLPFDLVSAMASAIDGRLIAASPLEPDAAAVCVVLASGGYPGPYTTGRHIRGLETSERDTIVFHAGTRRDGERCLTAGGRVLGVTARGADVAEARSRAYRGVERIHFEDAVWRSDIAAGAR